MLYTSYQRCKTSGFNNKKLFKESFHSLMSSLKENKESREFFVLYSQVENKKFKDKVIAEEYLDQVIKILKSKKPKLKLNKINNTIKKYSKKLKETNNVVYNNLDLLVFNEEVLNIEDKIKAKKSLLRVLLEVKSESISEAKIPNSLLINLATKKFNEKFSSLSSVDKKTFNESFIKNGNTIKSELDIVINEVNDKLDNLISDSTDIKLIKKLKETRFKINESKYDKVSLYKIKELNKIL
jgi:hypothetical protein